MADYVPSLTLEPNLGAAAAAAPEVKSTAVEAPDLEIEKLSEAEQKAVHDFADKIDITNSNLVLQYGAASQKNVSDFSETTLKSVRTKDMGEVGDMLSGLVVELKGLDFSEGEKKGLFRKAKNRMATLKAQYDKVEVNVDKTASILKTHQVTLLKDVALYDKMYELNQAYFKELTMYILAGKEKLAKCRNEVLPGLQEKAHASGLPEDAQAAKDYADMCLRFEKKIYDLELTRNMAIQMSPQIRLLQNNDTLMAEKIQSTIINTIPLWKNQMVLAIGMEHSKQAMQAERAVNDMTNELLKKNAELLKQGSIEIAKESERGIIDIETLRETNQKLIDTLTEVKNIQDEGSQKRHDAETELNEIEKELKAKLLEINNSTSNM